MNFPALPELVGMSTPEAAQHESFSRSFHPFGFWVFKNLTSSLSRQQAKALVSEHSIRFASQFDQLHVSWLKKTKVKKNLSASRHLAS